jgi:hypothetical protein
LASLNTLVGVNGLEFGLDSIVEGRLGSHDDGGLEKIEEAKSNYFGGEVEGLGLGLGKSFGGVEVGRRSLEPANPFKNYLYKSTGSTSNPRRGVDAEADNDIDVLNRNLGLIDVENCGSKSVTVAREVRRPFEEKCPKEMGLSNSELDRISKIMNEKKFDDKFFDLEDSDDEI